MRRKRHRFDLDDRTDVAGNAQPKNMPHLGAVGGLFRDVLIKAAHLRHLVNIGFLDRDRPRRAALTLEREGKGVSEDIDRFSPLDRVLADEGRNALCQHCFQLSRRIFNDGHDMRRGQRLKIDFGAARPQCGADVPGGARRRANQHEIRRRAFLKEFFDVRRHFFVRRVKICRFKKSALILQHLEQFILQHRVHLADLVDE